MTPQEELTAIKARIAEIERKLAAPTDTGVWVPKIGDTFFYVWAAGAICEDVWKNEEADFAMRALGNVYKCKVEAEIHVERRKAYVAVVRKLREIAGGFVPDWEDKAQRKYFLYRNRIAKKWEFGYVQDAQYPAAVHFRCEKDARAALALGSELDALLYDGVVR